MATIRNRNGRWHVQIRKANARPISRTFIYRKDAELWAREREREIELEGCGHSKKQLLSQTLSDLISRYEREEGKYKKSYAVERHYFNSLKRETICQIPLSQLTPSDLQDWINDRRSSHKPASTLRLFGIFKRVLNIAIRRWGYPIENPTTYVAAPTAKPPPIGRIDSEVLSVLYKPQHKFDWLVVFALETGMRRGEIINMRWVDILAEKRLVQLHETKNGYGRFVPLSPKAMEAIEHGDKDNEFVFPMTGNAIRLAWDRFRRRHGIVGVRFHDLRHEAISRMFDEGMTMSEVAAISGHRTASMLFRYAHADLNRLKERFN
jgi:integrase